MEYTENKSSKKLIIFEITCVLIIIALIGYTYSYFNVSVTNDTTISGRVASLSLTLNVSRVAPSNTNGLIPQLDQYITSAVIGRNGSCIDDNNNNVCQVYQIKVKNTSSVSLYANGTVALNANNNPNLKWAQISGTTSPTLVSSVNTPSTITLVQNELFTANQEKIYYIVVWISETGEAQYDTGNFTGVVTFGDASSIAEVDDSGANSPKLVDNLIPVYYNEESKSWITTDNSNEGTKWYNYSDKKWANAVLVDSSVRTSYQTPETPIDISKVLAFYVWIPRYKYKVWNINKVIGTDTYDAYNTGIDIIFENGTETTGTITCEDYDFTVTEGNGLSETCSDIQNGNGYYTHPAFTFGEDEIQGFWMGKFEISNSTSLVKILPNVQSLTTQTVSAFWSAIYNMQSSSNSYGLTTDRTVADSHMLTNMEWGAVAYLTHSDYGRCTDGTCTEVAINNSSSRYTGRSSGSPNSTTTSANGSYTYDENIIETSLVEGTGTEVTPTISHDATYPWTENNGVYSSGNAGTNNSSSTLTYTFTLSSLGAISFDYSVSSENNYDNLSYTITNSQSVVSVTGTAISGTTRGTAETSLTYDSVTHVLDAENYTLTFTYAKDSSSARGLDKGYVKNIKVQDGAETITEDKGPGGQLASTTGNVYGVYDMSGGANEYVMGNMGSSDTAGTSYTYYASNAGTNYTYTGYEKYLTTYSYGANYYNQNAYNRGRLGDATAEIVLTASPTGGWYGDYSYFPGSPLPWFSRGGVYNSGAYAGVMYFYYYYGDSYSGVSSRAALIGF